MFLQAKKVMFYKSYMKRQIRIITKALLSPHSSVKFVLNILGNSMLKIWKAKAKSKRKMTEFLVL